MKMLPSQRALFEIPEDVAYLDTAAYGALPRAVREAGEVGVAVKSTPWTRQIARDDAWAERCRTAAAKLIGADADGIALVGSVSHGIATAALNTRAAPGSRILRIAQEFPSQVLAWDRFAARTGAVVDEVARPADGDWTQALLDRIAPPGAPPLAVATLTPLHWTDGSRIDLDRLAPAVRAAGAALVIDATQAVGAMPIDVTRWDPDFLAFPTYKWVLGPYSQAFLYVAPRHRDGEPLEPNTRNQENAPGARRFDKGERNDPVGLPMAATGMELVLSWGPANIAARLGHLTGMLADALTAQGVAASWPAQRVGHILGLQPANALPEGTAAALAAQGVHVSERGTGLRVSPHVHATEDDIARAAAAIARLPAFRA